MSRLLLVLAIFALLLTLAPAAPVPTHLIPTDPPLRHPAAVGSRWVYERSGQKDELVLTVTAAETKGRVTTVHVGLVVGPGKPSPWETVEVRPDGWFRTHVQGLPFDRPLCQLVLPHRPERTWDTHVSVGRSSELKGTKAAQGWEWVSVPAGTYRAAKVESVYTLRGSPCRATFWYADGVGEVKMVRESGSERVLKSFTPGKK